MFDLVIIIGVFLGVFILGIGVGIGYVILVIIKLMRDGKCFIKDENTWKPYNPFRQKQ